MIRSILRARATARSLNRPLSSVATLSICAALLTTAATARAGTYTAWSCRDGANASTEGLSDWSHSSLGAGYVSSPGVSCYAVQPPGINNPFGTAVYADTSNNPNVVSDDMALIAPSGVTITGARLWWRGEAGTRGQVAALAVWPDGTQTVLIDRRDTRFPAVGDPDAGGPPIDTLDLGAASGLVLRSACVSDCQSGGGDASLASYSAYRVALSVADPTAPTGNATGGLMLDAVLKGQRSVAVNAADTGAGVYLARVVADGDVAASSGFGARPCGDVDATNSDPFEFSTVRPCPGKASTTVSLDTSKLSEDLRHHIRVEVVDAAGNETVVAERVVGVDNQPAAKGFFDRAIRRFQNPMFDIAAARRLNGDAAASIARLRVYLPVSRPARATHHERERQSRRVDGAAGERTVAFDARPTLRAVLTDSSGRPIAHAAVWVAVRDEGSDWQIIGSPHVTSKTGRIGLRLPPGSPSRQVNVVYFPFSDSHDQVVGRPVRLKVRAGVTLGVSTRRVRNGDRVEFTGGVKGLRTGQRVIASLQARLRGRYRSFRQLTIRGATAAGFRTAYRFTRTRRTTRYRFRVVVLKQAGLPYERGASTVRTVLVTP